MNPDQTNTRAAGPFAVLAGEDLTGKRSRLVALTHDTGVPEVKLPTSNNALGLYLLNEEGLDGAMVEVEPLAEGGKNVRIPLVGTCNPGDILVAADTAGADKGKVRALPAGAGAYVQVGIAEEVGVATQHVKLRPCPKLVQVASSIAAPAATTTVNGAIAALNSTAVNPTKADFDALLAALETIADEQRADNAKLIALHTAAVAAGIVVTP